METTFQRIYMDHHATTPLDPRVLETMMPYLTSEFGNASSNTHAFGWRAKEAVELARQQIAKLIGCNPEEIIFTNGATESDNLAIKGVAQQYRRKGNHLITSQIEHSAILESCKTLEKDGFEVTYLPVDQYGMVAAKDYFFDNQKRNSFLSRMMNLIPADRSARRETIIKLMVACREFTRHGNRSLIIYPEGTRSQTGEMTSMKKGPAMIAATLGLPIVPVYINGTHRAYPKGGSVIKPSRIRVHIGEPIDSNRFQDERDSGRTIYAAMTREMEKRIHKLKEIHGRS